MVYKHYIPIFFLSQEITDQLYIWKTRMEKRLLSREFRLKLRKVYYCVLENVSKTFYCHLKASFRSFKTYVYTFYSYTSISCTFILFITLHQPTASTFPSPSYVIFSFAALWGEILMWFLILRSRKVSGLIVQVSKMREQRLLDFFPICNKNNWNRIVKGRLVSQVVEQQ